VGFTGVAVTPAAEALGLLVTSASRSGIWLDWRAFEREPRRARRCIWPRRAGRTRRRSRPGRPMTPPRTRRQRAVFQEGRRTNRPRLAGFRALGAQKRRPFTARTTRNAIRSVPLPASESFFPSRRKNVEQMTVSG